MPAYGEGNVIVQDGDNIERYSGFSSTLSDSFNHPDPISPGDTHLTTAPDDDVIGIDISSNDTAWRFSSFTSTVTDSFSTSQPSSVAWRDGHGVQVMDGDDQNIYGYQWSGFSPTVTDSFTDVEPFGSVDLNRIDGHEWVGDHVEAFTYIFADSDRGVAVSYSGFTDTLTDSFIIGDDETRGLSWDGTDRMRVQDATHWVEKYSGFSSQISDSFDPGGNIINITWDDYSVRTTSGSEVKYRAEFETRTGNTCRVDISLSGYTGDIQDRWVSPDTSIVYGDPGGKNIEPVLPSHVRLQMTDEDGQLRQDINSNPDDWLPVDVYFEDESLHWNGKIRTDTVERILATDLELPVADFFAYDGIEGLNELEYERLDGLMENLLSDILDDVLDSALEQDIEMVHSWFGLNADKDGVQADVLGLSGTSRKQNWERITYWTQDADDTSSDILTELEAAASTGDSEIQVDQTSPYETDWYLMIFGPVAEVVKVKNTYEDDNENQFVTLQDNVVNDHDSGSLVVPVMWRLQDASPFYQNGPSKRDVVAELMRKYGLRLWNGLDEKWKVWRELAIGEQVQVAAYNQEHLTDDTTQEGSSALSAESATVTDDDWRRDATEKILRAIGRFDVARSNEAGERNIVQDADGEEWPDANVISSPWREMVETLQKDPAWSGSDQGTRDIEVTGTVDSGASDNPRVRNYLQMVSPESGPIKWRFFSEVRPGPGILDLKFYIWGRDGTKKYLNESFTWQDAETSITAEWGGRVMQFPGNAPPPPISGLLVMEFGLAHDSDLGSSYEQTLRTFGHQVMPENLDVGRGSPSQIKRSIKENDGLAHTGGSRHMVDDGTSDPLARDENIVPAVGWYPNDPNWLYGELAGAIGFNILSTDEGFAQTGTATGDALATDQGTVVSKLSSFTNTVKDSFSTTYQPVGGITWFGSDVVGTDQNTPNLFRHSGFSQTVTDSFSAPVQTVEGITMDNDHVYAASQQDQEHLKFDGFSASVIDSFNSTAEPWGIFYNGTDYFLSDPQDENIVRLESFGGSVTDSFSTPDTDITGIENVRGAILSVDNTTENFYEHSDYTSTIVDSFSNPLGGKPLGLAWDEPSERLTDAGGGISGGITQGARFFKHSGFSAQVTDSFSRSELGKDLAWTGDDTLGVLLDVSTGGQLGSDEMFAGGENNSNLLRFSDFSSTLKDSFSSPGDRPTGLTWDGTDLYSVDNTFQGQGGDYYHHSAFSSTIKDSFSAPFAHALSIDQDGDFIGDERTDSGGSDDDGNSVVKFSGFSSTIKHSFSQAGANGITGVTWDGTDFYWMDTSSSANNDYRRNSGFTSTVVDSFTQPFANGDIIAASNDGTDHFLKEDNDGFVSRQSGFSATMTDSFDAGLTTSDFGGLEWGNYSDRTGATSGQSTADMHLRFSEFISTVKDSYSSPGVDPRGITWTTGGDVVSTDETIGVLEHSGFSDVITDSFSSPKSAISGTAIQEDGDLLTADHTAKSLFRHSAVTSTIKDSFSHPDNDPRGVGWVNGDTLSTGNDFDNHLRHSGFSATITDSYSSPFDHPYGIEVDNFAARTQGDTGDLQLTENVRTAFPNVGLREVVIDPLGANRERIMVNSFSGTEITPEVGLEKGHDAGEEVRPIFHDLTELQIENRLHREGDNLDVISGDLWDLHPPREVLDYDSRTWAVAGGLELHLRDEFTSGTWYEKKHTFNTP